MQTKQQRETAIRYIIFIAMLWGMLHVWASDGIKGFNSFSTPIVLFFYGESVESQIVSCVSDYTFKTSRPYRNITGQAPLARGKNAVTATGSYLHNNWNPGWCKRQIGKRVTMLIHPEDPRQNRIASFTQLWYIPFQGLLAIFWVLVASRIKALFWLTFIFNATIIPAAFWITDIS